MKTKEFDQLTEKETDMNVERTADTDLEKVMITGELASRSVSCGERVRLVNINGIYTLKDEEDKTVFASLCVNIPRPTAEKLSRVEAEFEVSRSSEGIFKAVLTEPCSLVHHGCGEWYCIC